MCWALWLFTASLAGCSRLLNWLPDHRTPVKKSLKVVEKPDTSQKRTGKPPQGPPDLAVVKGSDPEENLRRALERLGGIEKFVKRNAKVVIKPNLLTAKEPEYAVTTNPLLVGALVKMCYEAGARIVVVLDRPVGSPRLTFEVSGIAKATQSAGGQIKILTDRNFENTLIPEGQVLKSWPLAKDVFEADVFINVPIAKDHSLATLTMAMKNLMGIMGGNRSQVHINFHQKIVDLNTLVRPHLVVLDAHRILVRNGPTGGSLSDVKVANTLVVGTNQVSVDAYGATLFGLAPENLLYLILAKERSLGEINLNKLKIIKENLV
jgi:uncharacterized protein (DUF362 family)